jgi:deoxyribose-phosphate aldolase
MNEIKKIALQYFVRGEEKKCRCGGGHEVCLNCKICRMEGEDQTVKKITTLAEFIDHTNLKPDSISADITKLCEEAESFHFKAVCINPFFVTLCQSALKSSASLVCSVVGFPLGANNSEIKGEETRHCIREGAAEIDMVNNIALIKERDISSLLSDIGIVSDICFDNDVDLKVIIETCLLTTEEKIIACLAAKKSGALFVKTSTGFSSAGATVDDVSLMREIVGPKLGVKASGGVRSTDLAVKMLEAGANRIGTSNGVSIVESFRR